MSSWAPDREELHAEHNAVCEQLAELEGELEAVYDDPRPIASEERRQERIDVLKRLIDRDRKKARRLEEQLVP